MPTEPVHVQVDALRLSQAMSNLLTNAAKYTDAGGRIELTASINADDLRITVKDTGIGLSAAALPKVFEMFSQVNSAIDRADGGLGIGLALVKGLVTLHGGTVEAASAGPGFGSEFTICIPQAIVEVRKRAVRGVIAREAPARAGRCRVLVADDNRDAVDSLALLLESFGYEALIARSGPEALEVGNSNQPDVVVMDIGMPGMTGYETARRIRQHSWGRSALLIAVTGWGQEEDKLQAREAGFDHHLSKPVDVEDILRLLGDFLKQMPA
jgi:CheY-like chemotaxis protein